MANSISILMLAVQIVKSIVSNAVTKDTRMAASLLRLHFHDCFVKGCDASILLDNSSSIISEKGSNPNRNSVRGFDVIDQIKSTLERECPQTVSCADIMALDAWDSTVLTGGPSWEVSLGRRDSRGARLSGSNYNIPAPNNTFQTILTKFKLQGLDIVDLVALSGHLWCSDSSTPETKLPGIIPMTKNRTFVGATADDDQSYCDKVTFSTSRRMTPSYPGYHPCRIRATCPIFGCTHTSQVPEYTEYLRLRYLW
ncbi:hypothetical protein AgCh_006461 [Apium graveolens]